MRSQTLDDVDQQRFAVASRIGGDEERNLEPFGLRIRAGGFRGYLEW